jgi:hypothetical protein
MSKKTAYSTEELVQAATWAVSYENDAAYAARFRKVFKKEPPDQKRITAWKKELLETGMPTCQLAVTAIQQVVSACYLKATRFSQLHKYSEAIVS